MALLGRDERAWIRAAQAGSVSDLESLYRAHWPRAYRAAYLVVQDHGEAEAIVEDTFLAAVRGLQGFGGDRPFGPWLHRTVTGRAVDAGRARLARRHATGESFLDVTDPLWPGVDGQAHAHLDPGTRALAVALAALTPEQRAVLVLRHLLEYTLPEIADLLELSRSTVNERLRRAREQLDARLQEATP